MTRAPGAARAPATQTHADRGADLQTPMDAAVVIAAMPRPSLAHAPRSVFAQAFAGRPTAFHVLDPDDAPHDARPRLFGDAYARAGRHGDLELDERGRFETPVVTPG